MKLKCINIYLCACLIGPDRNPVPTLDIRLLRRLCRWELRNKSLYSCAVVYDCTMISDGNAYQTTYLRLQDEFKGMDY